MCTLIALHRTLSEAALLVAANRDEFYERPSEGPALRPTPAGWVVAPLDAEAGGTWFGVSRRGLFAALTNVSSQDRDPLRRSRGLLVRETLEAESAEEAARRAERLPADAYNAFNLFVADAESAHAFTYQGRARRIPVDDGVFVIGNAPLDVAAPAKLARLEARVRELAAGPAPEALAGLEALCRDHTAGPRGALDAVCVHTPLYGTRSSALLQLAPAGPAAPASALRFAGGAPCRTGYEDFTPLLRDLGQGSPGATGAWS